MATSSPNPGSASESKPAKRPFVKSPFSLVDLSGGFTNRQIRVDKATYEQVEALTLQFKKQFASELGTHRLTLEEVLVMCVQAGAVALTADPNASRRLP